MESKLAVFHNNRNSFKGFILDIVSKVFIFTLITGFKPQFFKITGTVARRNFKLTDMSDLQHYPLNFFLGKSD